MRIGLRTTSPNQCTSTQTIGARPTPAFACARSLRRSATACSGTRLATRCRPWLPACSRRRRRRPSASGRASSATRTRARSSHGWSATCSLRKAWPNALQHRPSLRRGRLCSSLLADRWSLSSVSCRRLVREPHPSRSWSSGLEAGSTTGVATSGSRATSPCGRAPGPARKSRHSGGSGARSCRWLGGCGTASTWTPWSFAPRSMRCGGGLTSVVPTTAEHCT